MADSFASLFANARSLVFCSVISRIATTAPSFLPSVLRMGCPLHMTILGECFLGAMTSTSSVTFSPR